MTKLQPGDHVILRCCLWDDWMEIEAVNNTLFGKRYIATVIWADVGPETYAFRRWRVKAWLK